MRRKYIFPAILSLIVVLALAVFVPVLSAETAPPTPDELDQLLAPVALYPDSLLAQITTASTNPQEILDVDNWLQANPDLTGSALTDAAEKQGFDPAFVALVNFPDVLEMMAEHIDDYAAIGQAFLADQESVAASIQRLRAKAYEAGSLRTDSQQQVEVQQAAPGRTVYVIQPANPQVVYVPVYDPTVVYVAPAPGVVVSAPLITFGPGIGIGVLLVDNRPWGWGGWGWNWGSRRAYYNHAIWVGWGNPYRPPNYWYRPRPIVWASRPGYRNNWGYRPPHYNPPRPGRQPGYGKPPYGPSNPPGKPPSGKPGTRPPNKGKPEKRPPNGGKPGTPTNGKPGTKPPSSGKPGTPTNGKPGTRPPSSGKPGTPTNGKPGTNPPTEGKPGTNPPSGGKPSTRPPSGGKPGTPTNGRPGTNPPSSDQPGTKPPSTGRPGTKPPSSGQPSTKPPTSSRPSTGQPSKGPSATPAPTKGTNKPETQKPTSQPKPSSKSGSDSNSKPQQ